MTRLAQTLLGGLFLGIAAAHLWKHYNKAIEFTPEALKAIRMGNEPLEKLLSIMEDMNKNGLLKSIAKYVPQDQLDSFVNDTLFYGFSKSSTRLCECKVGGLFVKVALKLFENEYGASLKIVPAKYELDGKVHTIEQSVILKYITQNPEKYDVILKGEDSVLNERGVVDLTKLDALVRKDPEEKLYNTMSCDDFTILERAVIIKGYYNEAVSSRTSEFKSDLVKLHQYFYDPKGNTELVDEIYGAANTAEAI